MDVEAFIVKHQTRRIKPSKAADLESVLQNGGLETEVVAELGVINDALSEVVRYKSNAKRHLVDYTYTDYWINLAFKFFSHAIAVHNKHLSTIDVQNPTYAETLESKAWIVNTKANIFSNMFYLVLKDKNTSLKKKLHAGYHAQGNKYAVGRMLQAIEHAKATNIFDIATRLAKDNYFVAKVFHPFEENHNEHYTLPFWGHRWRRSAQNIIKSTEIGCSLERIYAFRKLGDAYYNMSIDYDPSAIKKAKTNYEIFLQGAQDKTDPALEQQVKKITQRLLKEIYPITTQY
ncbi:hypothetical protein K9M74_05515 [Candidatus Woesearchaeota archaeon]|nr:hypothetical protein [Candidatus Woesearchaeota archaeon]